MRCQKCQYVGFEPSPRCRNCGYDFSLTHGDLDPSSDDREIDARPIDDAPGLTLVTEPELEAPMADFDLQIFDVVPAKRVQGGAKPFDRGAKPFDLDDLLANGPASGSLSGARRDTAPVIQTVSAVARRRQSASASASSSPSSPSAVATPPPTEIGALFKPAPMVATLELVIDDPLPAPAPATTELPLFMQGMSVHAPVPSSIEAAADAAGELRTVASHEIDDRPLVQVPSSPRAPLSVRRTTPDPARLRAKYGRAAARSKVEPVETSGDLLNDAADTYAEPRIVPPAQRLSSEPTPSSLPAEWVQGVGPVKRITAAALDSALLIGLNAAVVWFTLSVCGLTPDQANLLPVAPLLLFFLLLDAGYLVLFTAACGQTIGKMAAGIRVVGTTTGSVINDRITIAQAVMRSLGSIVSMLPLGAGFWFGLVGDRRAVHDRLAHTRVISL